jgi:hypothetical protein
MVDLGMQRYVASCCSVRTSEPGMFSTLGISLLALMSCAVAVWLRMSYLCASGARIDYCTSDSGFFARHAVRFKVTVAQRIAAQTSVLPARGAGSALLWFAR